MPDYPLSLTASEIDAALQKASNPDTEPQQNNNLITSGGVKTYVDSAISGVEADISGLEADVLAKTAGAVIARTAEFSVTSESYQTIPLDISKQNDFLSANNNDITITAGHYLMWHKFEWKSQSALLVRPQININVLSGDSDFFGSMENPFFPANGNTTWQNEVRLTAFYKYVSSDTTFRMQLRDDPNYNTATHYIKNLSWLFLKI